MSPRDELEALTDGLSFPTEIDSPVEAIGPFAEETGRQIVERLAPGLEVRKASRNDFFGTLTERDSYFAAREPDAHRRYVQLEQLIAKWDRVEFWYAGDVEAWLFLLGQQEPSGPWFGLRTAVVET